MKCSPDSCNCSSARSESAWNRRAFLKWIGLGASALATEPWQAMAGPFSRQDFDKLVPADKKLRPEWVHSLTARGERAVYRGDDLNRIGMPIGGLCAGQVYLGGDGRLWHWDIFNHRISTGADHYAKPMSPAFPFEQAFKVTIQKGGPAQPKVLDRSDWRNISFNGEYPLATIEYRDPEMPVSVTLQAYSPFIPLNTEDSSLPATILEFAVRNESSETIEMELTGLVENPVCLNSGQRRPGLRQNRVIRKKELLILECSAREEPARKSEARPDILFEDFEDAEYTQWTVEGTAFGKGPVELNKVPAYQGNVGGHGKRAVNSHATAPGESVEQKDAATGKLTSQPFPVSRNYIHFLIGGGAHEGKTCMNLLVDGQVVASATGQNSNRMKPASWDVRRWMGKPARLEIVDQETGSWGNIGIDDIRFSDLPEPSKGLLTSEPDFGTFVLALLEPRRGDFGDASNASPEGSSPNGLRETRPFSEKLVGSLVRKMKLRPGASASARFLLAWHMPNLNLDRLPAGRYYARRFSSAAEVAIYVARNYRRLSGQTKLWHSTWYDSSLPYWFLDRTFLNSSILATSTCYRLGNGRFYAWEGVGCCEGTCGHVWQYAHAAARLFPDLERRTREEVDFGLALQPDGAIHFRGEFNDFPAIDAQAGTILRALREHQMSAESSFLKRNWSNIKRATEWLIRKDANDDGLIESNQHNTLDTDWYGPVAWLSGLYLAALAAAEAMAQEVGDEAFASRCRQILARGRDNLCSTLFDGEYFINKPDARHLDAINSGTGCEIDQVYGQSWAFQVGLPRVLPERQTRSALRSLWRYNFTPDVGPYREHYKAGRWYAMPGEAGLLMCTFPRSDWDYAQAKGKGPDWAAGYFNECMNGFEYQAAGHMIWEELITEGLAVTRAVHDRYHPSRRNPWNEIECGDHYARSKASYGVFLAACGFEYHGPKGHLGFAPRVFPDGSHPRNCRFKAAFTSSEGWGSFSLDSRPDQLVCEIRLQWGKLHLNTLALGLPEHVQVNNVKVRSAGHDMASSHLQENRRVFVTFSSPLSIQANEVIKVRLS